MSDKPFRRTDAARAVLAALPSPPAEAYGREIMRATGVPSGTAYPLLGRLERHGLVASRWETVDPGERGGRPARRYYRRTGSGEKLLAEWPPPGC